jgi:DNA-binding transcriptional LysR family regulator
VVVRPRIVVTSFELGIAAAVAGLGIVPCAQIGARPYLAKKALVPVLEAWTPPRFEVTALFGAGGTPLPKTRLMVDALSAWFKARRGRI